MSFRIAELDPAPFRPVFGLPDAELRARGVVRHAVDASPGHPDRIELRDAAPGETVLPLNHVHQGADTPYRASHAIFVREGTARADDLAGEIPPVLAIRLLSRRAFDRDHVRVDADVVEGRDLEAAIERMSGDPRVGYLHDHSAGLQGGRETWLHPNGRRRRVGRTIENARRHEPVLAQCTDEGQRPPASMGTLATSAAPS